MYTAHGAPHTGMRRNWRIWIGLLFLIAFAFSGCQTPTQKPSSGPGSGTQASSGSPCASPRSYAPGSGQLSEAHTSLQDEIYTKVTEGLFDNNRPCLCAIFKRYTLASMNPPQYHPECAQGSLIAWQCGDDCIVYLVCAGLPKGGALPNANPYENVLNQGASVFDIKSLLEAVSMRTDHGTGC